MIPFRLDLLGTTSFGTPVEVNSLVVDADFRISTGFIEPHFFAGFSGGRKSISPGVSSARAIRSNHCYAMVGHPKAKAGILEGNPVHEDQVEQAKMAKLDFIVNVLLNSEKQITHVLAGNPWSAHLAACEIEKGIVQSEIDHKVDITIVTNGGAPLDLDFYQTVKGIDTAAKITRPGGAIIVASSCHAGVGTADFKALHAGSHSAQEVLEKIKCGPTAGVDWQNQILACAQLDHTIYLYSKLADAEVKSMLVNPVHSVEEGLEEAFKLLGREAEIAVIPEGPLVLPVVRGTVGQSYYESAFVLDEHRCRKSNRVSHRNIMGTPGTKILLQNRVYRDIVFSARKPNIFSYLLLSKWPRSEQPGPNYFIQGTSEQAFYCHIVLSLPIKDHCDYK